MAQAFRVRLPETQDEDIDVPAWLKLTSSQQTLLKWVAIALMVLDHANRTLWTFQPWAFALGRIAFPLFAFLIAYNLAVREVKPRRYLLPFLLFGVISQGPAMLALGRDPFPLNIFFTLFLGVTMLGLERGLSQRLPENLLGRLAAWTLATLVVLVPSLWTEYGPLGVLLIPLLTLFLRQPSFSRGLPVLFLLVILNGFTETGLPALGAVAVVAIVARLKLPSLVRGKWFFYGFYPLHLLVLWSLSRLLVAP